MSDEVMEKLKQRVMDFVLAQEGYDNLKHEKLKAFCENKDYYAVVYGDDIQSGLAGFGQTPDDAYNDFVQSWNHFKGFQWIEKNKTAGLHHWKDKKQ